MVKKGPQYTDGLRLATEKDVPVIWAMIHELAAYEHLEDQVMMTPQDLCIALFQKTVAEAILLEWQGETAGYAIYYETFSTFTARAGLYLEDLYVRPAYRGHGLGSAVLDYLTQKAKDEDRRRVDWECLNWNAPSIAFYKNLGAVHQAQWLKFRLEVPAIQGEESKRSPDL